MPPPLYFDNEMCQCRKIKEWNGCLYRISRAGASGCAGYGPHKGTKLERRQKVTGQKFTQREKNILIIPNCVFFLELRQNKK